MPRFLVAVAGHASSPGHHRGEALAANLHRIASMARDGSIKLTACLVYVHAAEAALPTEKLASRLPRACAVVRNTGGSFLSHIVQIPAELISSSHYVSILIDSVVLGVDTHFGWLARIMAHNCLHIASPACSTCKTKRTINHDYRREVGRYVDAIDFIANVYSSAAFRCLQNVANQTAEVDRWAWETYWIFWQVCSHYALNRTGVVDAMSVDKIETGSSYNWSAAEATNEKIRQELKARRPELFHSAPAHRDTRSGEALSPPTHDSAAAVSREKDKEREAVEARAVDVLVIEPPTHDERSESQVAALMRAVRFRLSAHSRFAGATVICESTITSVSLKPLRSLSSYPALWLGRDELLRSNVSHVRFPVARYEKRMDMKSYGMGSIFKLTRILWRSLIAHVEVALPGRLVFMSSLEELLEAETLLR